MNSLATASAVPLEPITLANSELDIAEQVPNKLAGPRRRISDFGQLFLTVEDAEHALALLNVSTQVVPTPVGHFGQFLTNDGVGMSWADIDGVRSVASLTGSVSASSLKTALSLDQVNNTTDANKPISTATATALSGKADLLDGKVLTSQLPSFSLDEIFTVSSQAAMLALAAAQGDIAIRTDLLQTFILATNDPTQLTNWKLLPTPTDSVLSINGQTGVIVLGASDVGAQPINSNLTAIAALTTTSFGRSLLTQTNAAAARSTIGAGTSSFGGLFTGLDFTSSNLNEIATRNFSSLQNIPTTISGYGISDLLGNVVSGATIYVDADNGTSGGARGTAKPFATLAQALAVAVAGDLIVMRPGTYTISSAAVISLANITVLGCRGVKIVAASETTGTLLQLAADGITLEGLDISGARTSSTSVQNWGTVYSTATNAKIRHCIIHDTIGRAIYASGNVNGLEVSGCEIYNFYQGVACDSITGSSGVYRLRVDGNTIHNTWATTAYPGAIKLHNTAGALITGSASYNTIWAGGGSIDEVGIESQGGFRGVQVIGNVISNWAFGISNDSNSDTTTSDNVINGCLYAGIEYVDATTGVASNNIIDGKKDDGTLSGGSGYSISTNSGSIDANINIIGGAITNCSVAVHSDRSSGIFLRNIYIYQPAGGIGQLSFQRASNITVEGCRVDLQVPTSYGIFTEIASGNVTVSGFYYRNNVFRYSVGGTRYAVYHFYSSDGTGTINDVTIEGTRATPAGFWGSGIVDSNGPIVNISYRNNQPHSADATAGFPADDLPALKLDNLTASTFVMSDASKGLVSRTATQMRTDLGLVIGTNVQAYDAELSALAAKGADIASASTTNLATATGSFVNVTGTTTINGFGTVAVGLRRMIRFTGAGTITYNATSMILPRSANIVRRAGDYAVFESLGSGNWRCLDYYSPDWFDYSTANKLNLGNGSLILNQNDSADFPNGLTTTGIFDGHASTAGYYVGATYGWRWLSSNQLVGLDNKGYLGINDDSNAPTGYIGEYISASVVQASAVSLTTATAKTVTSISLTAGDWDITAVGALTGASTGTEFDVAIGTTTNSLTGTVLGDTRCQTPTVSLAGADATLMIPAVRASLDSTTTYYLIVQETFTLGSPKAYGRISARRVR